MNKLVTSLLALGGKINVDVGITDPDAFVTKLFTVIMTVAGLTSLVFMMIGGFKLMTAQGDGNKYQEGTGTIAYAAVGLVVVALSGLIANYVAKILGLPSLYNLSVLLS